MLKSAWKYTKWTNIENTLKTRPKGVREIIHNCTKKNSTIMECYSQSVVSRKPRLLNGVKMSSEIKNLCIEFNYEYHFHKT